MKKTRFWDTSWSWKGIWRTKAPIKVACGWIAAWGSCVTRDNLQKKGFALSNRCYLCEEELETEYPSFALQNS